MGWGWGRIVFGDSTVQKVSNSIARQDSGKQHLHKSHFFSEKRQSPWTPAELDRAVLVKGLL